MPVARVTRSAFLDDAQGKKFADVVDDPKQVFDAVLEFFNDPQRQRRMEESELHHDRSPLAGVVRELESHPPIDEFFSGMRTQRSTRLRQAIGVLVRVIMEQRGWRKTGKKGSLGVRAAEANGTPTHNTGGLAFWFIRAERYVRAEGMLFRSVKERCQDMDAALARESVNGARASKPRAASSRSNKASEPPQKIGNE